MFQYPDKFSNTKISYNNNFMLMKR